MVAYLEESFIAINFSIEILTLAKAFCNCSYALVPCSGKLLISIEDNADDNSSIDLCLETEYLDL